MGAESFIQVARGENAGNAFRNAVSEALHDHGHSGYTGTIAEKESFTMITVPEDFPDRPSDFAEDLIQNEDPRIDDKWGPAGCIDLNDGTFMFFGWASS